MYYQFGNNNEYTQFRNITLKDFAWSIKSTDEFIKMYGNECKPVEVFSSKRLTGFNKDKIIIKGGYVYHLLTKKEFDGYLYEVNATDLKVFNKKDYPNIQFAYTKYHIDSLKGLDRNDIEILKVDEVIRFNGNHYYDVHMVGAICDKVYEYINNL